jgi:hypothetical protein
LSSNLDEATSNVNCRYCQSRVGEWIPVTILRRRTFIFKPCSHCRKLGERKAGQQTLASSNDTGYLCFLENTVSSPHGGPLCLDDVNNNATIPLGNYTIIFLATKIPQGATFPGFFATGGLSVGNWTQYADPSSYQAPLIVAGDETIIASWSISPVPEFNGIAVVAFAALAASLWVLRRRRR